MKAAAILSVPLWTEKFLQTTFTAFQMSISSKPAYFTQNQPQELQARSITDLEEYLGAAYKEETASVSTRRAKKAEDTIHRTILPAQPASFFLLNYFWVAYWNMCQQNNSRAKPVLSNQRNDTIVLY